MYGVDSGRWVNFVGYPQDLALPRMEFHIVLDFPGLEGIQVFLEDFVVFVCFDSAVLVQEAVVCKEANNCTWGQ